MKCERKAELKEERKNFMRCLHIWIRKLLQFMVLLWERGWTFLFGHQNYIKTFSAGGASILYHQNIIINSHVQWLVFVGVCKGDSTREKENQILAYSLDNKYTTEARKYLHFSMLLLLKSPSCFTINPIFILHLMLHEAQL